MTLPHPQQGTAADTDSAGTPPRHTVGNDGTRPEHGALVRREYGLLATLGTAYAPSAWHAGKGGGGTTDQEANKGVPPNQRALPAHNMQKGEGGRTPDQEAK